MVRYADLDSPPFEQKLRVARFRREVNGLLQFWGHPPGLKGQAADAATKLHTVRQDRIISINEQ